MNVEIAVMEHLSADAGVSALVVDRVYQFKLPQNGDLPAVRMQLVDEPSAYHLRGERNLTRARLQIDAYAEEGNGTDAYSQAVAVADAVHAALSGQKFISGAGSPAEIQVTGAYRDSRRVLHEANELNLVRIMQDYIVWSRQI